MAAGRTAGSAADRRRSPPARWAAAPRRKTRRRDQRRGAAARGTAVPAGKISSAAGYGAGRQACRGGFRSLAWGTATLRMPANTGRIPYILTRFFANCNKRFSRPSPFFRGGRRRWHPCRICPGWRPWRFPAAPAAGRGGARHPPADPAAGRSRRSP